MPKGQKLCSPIHQDRKDRSTLMYGALDIIKMQSHADHNYSKPNFLIRSSPVVTYHLLHISTPSPWKPERSFSLPQITADSARCPPTGSKASNASLQTDFSVVLRRFSHLSPGEEFGCRQSTPSRHDPTLPLPSILGPGGPGGVAVVGMEGYFSYQNGFWDVF